MLLTLRGVLLLLCAAPWIALGTWWSSARLIGLAWFVLTLAMLVVDWRLAGRINRFDLRREHDTRLSLGAANPIRLHLHNAGLRPATFWVRDEPPIEFELDTRVLAGSAGPRLDWTGTYYLRPVRRGDYAFGDLNLRWLGPVGLVQRQGRVACSGPVKVYPNLLGIRRYDLLLRRNRLQELGLRHARRFGEGTEFERLREYLPDDGFRRINWKATARRNRPITTEYQPERSQNVMLVLDIGRMMQTPVERIAKLDVVINAALMLAYVATVRGDKVGLMTFADHVYYFSRPRQGRGQFYRLLERLYGAEPVPVEPDYAQAFSYLAYAQRKRSLIVTFTDLSGGLSMQALLRHVRLLARRSLPLVVTISDPGVHAMAGRIPGSSLEVYQRAAALELLEDRRLALETLRREGVLTLDVPADQLSISVINRYLELKGRMRL